MSYPLLEQPGKVLRVLETHFESNFIHGFIALEHLVFSYLNNFALNVFFGGLPSFFFD